MDQQITPGYDKEEDQDDSSSKRSAKSYIYKNYECSNVYIEILNKEKNKIHLIFRRPEDISRIKAINNNKIKELKEIKIIFDFQSLSNELNLENVKATINDFNKAIKNNNNETQLSIVIQNCVVNNFISVISDNNKLILNELIIGDELYNISPNLNIIFPKIKVNKLVLKKFKINSRLQLTNFCKFIINSECKELYLEDIFIELILKKNEKDTEYNDLESYFTYNDGIILLNNQYTSIRSLTLRDCPLFVIRKDMFKLNKEIEERNIDVDENCIINPSIITIFKIKDKKYTICFDLDSYKLSKESNNSNNNDNDNDNNNINNENKNEDYIDHLKYIFNIITGFLDDNKKKEENEEESEENDDEDDDDDIGKIDRENLYELKFKNFDTTKYEYITNEQASRIKEENWILNSEEEKKRKKKWEDFEKELKNLKFEKKLSSVKILKFENCTNFFVQWILYFIKGDENKEKDKDEEKNVTYTKDVEYNFELLKFKKCGKDYIDLKNILPMTIKTLILFDTPLIIDHFNNENKPHLDYFNNGNDNDKNKKNLGYVDNLIITINTLDYYNKEFYLNTYKTMEILVELIQCNNFNNNLSFNKNALPMIMTFLVCRKYYPKKDIYSNPDIDECGQDILDTEILKQINQDKDNKNTNDNNNKLTSVSKKIFFSTKILRDYAMNESFYINFPENSNISIVDALIKKQSENYENQNYLTSKKQGKKKVKNNEIKKLDTGNNYIETDIDFKTFFSINNINTVTLIKVELSHYTNNLIKDIEGDTILNLISFNEEEKNIISQNNFAQPSIPNYRIDMKTLNGFLFKNYLFEDIAAMFRFIMFNKGNDSSSFEKKTILKEFFVNYQKIFKTFKENNKKITFILNKVGELKELFCILTVAKVISDKKNWIKEEFNIHHKKKEIELPNKQNIEKEIGKYFLKDKNEDERDAYSEFNYYYKCYGEEKMLRDKNIKINDYVYYIDCQFDDYI